MLRCPLSLPLSKSYGARPTRAAICLRVIFPSSGNRAMSVKASTGPTPGIEVSSLVLGRNMLVTQLSPHGHDLGEPFDRSVPLHNSCRHDRNILCDQPRIEAIVLGQHAAGAGELTKLVRVDTSHRHSRREQGTDDSALVTTARLKANCGDCERAQPYDQLGPAGCVVTHRKEPPRQHHHIKALLRYVNTAKREHGHLHFPSFLMR